LYKIATDSSSKNPEKIRQGFELLSQALEKNDKNFAIHKWYAILLDAKSNLDGIKERCIQLQNVKKHMQVFKLKIEKTRIFNQISAVLARCGFESRGPNIPLSFG
jgi:hypothetical protein